MVGVQRDHTGIGIVDSDTSQKVRVHESTSSRQVCPLQWLWKWLLVRPRQAPNPLLLSQT